MNHIVEVLFDRLLKAANELGYSAKSTTNDKNIHATFSKESNSVNLTYTEEGERSGYSLYDLDVIVKVRNHSYILIRSERGEDDIAEDFQALDTILESVKTGKYSIIKERQLLIFRNTYMVIEDVNHQSIHLLETR
ncbi:MAG TPA: hypothetical protein VJ841_04770 [Candidatus Saccharimonadales bacterium]|nr:hypothetical protein [Candidatus Saccharimonadales bacterium]